MKIKKNLIRGLKLLAILLVSYCTVIPLYILSIVSAYYQEYVSYVILLILSTLIYIYASGYFVYKYKEWLFK